MPVPWLQGLWARWGSTVKLIASCAGAGAGVHHVFSPCSVSKEVGVELSRLTPRQCFEAYFEYRLLTEMDPGCEGKGGCWRLRRWFCRQRMVMGVCAGKPHSAAQSAGPAACCIKRHQAQANQCTVQRGRRAPVMAPPASALPPPPSPVPLAPASQVRSLGAAESRASAPLRPGRRLGGGEAEQGQVRQYRVNSKGSATGGTSVRGRPVAARESRPGWPPIQAHAPAIMIPTQIRGRQQFLGSFFPWPAPGPASPAWRGLGVGRGRHRGQSQRTWSQQA